MKKLLLLALLTFSASSFAIETKEINLAVVDPVDKLINTHLQKYAQQELFSAIQVSIRTKNGIKNYAAGTHSLTDKSPISTRDLFDIGSITKSFTAVLAVLAESEGKLDLQKPLSAYLQDYPHWENLTLRSLLDMSTGIPNYSDSPSLNYFMSKNLKQYWSQSDLIKIVYPKEHNPPLKPGYFYSNTGYVLMDMILSKIYNSNYETLLKSKILTPLKLDNSFYAVPTYPNNVLQRLVRGYSYNIYDNPELLGQDVTENNLSWAGAAGALVANTEDVAHWIEHLFIDDQLLNSTQKKSMQRLISLANGKPIQAISKQDPRGFGLGIVQVYDKELGSFWFYEGKTLGYRAFYIYVPCDQTIITAFFNSATNSENDHGHELLLALYKQESEQNTTYICMQHSHDEKSHTNSA